MDLATLDLLLSPAGQAALLVAGTLAPDDATFLASTNRLEKSFPPAVARAALSQAILRRKAAAKFRHASRMLFERAALEQATGEAVSAYRARRYAGLVADLCCGLGGDALALAARGPVLAIDRDPLRLALARHNVAACGLTGDFAEGDALALGLPDIQAAFLDPDRRAGGRRQTSIEACEPSLTAVRRRLGRDFPLGAKLAPAVPWRELEGLDAEVEFISLEGELKECAVWFGPLRTARRRATLLPAGDALRAEAPAPAAPVGAPAAYLYDPDPAVARAGLVTDLAQRLGARQLDADIAYLTSDTLTPTPFARAYAVEAALPFHLGRLRQLLRARHVGRVEVRRRGSAVDPEELVRKLKLSGAEGRALVLTRVSGRPWALVARPQP